MWVAAYGNVNVKYHYSYETMNNAPVIKFKDTGDGIKVGEIRHLTGCESDFYQKGFFPCDGNCLDKTNFPELYAQLGDFYTNYNSNVYGVPTSSHMFRLPLESYFVDNSVPAPKTATNSQPTQANSIQGKSLCNMLHSHLNLCDTDLYGVITHVNRGGNGIQPKVFGPVFELRDTVNPICEAEWTENGVCKNWLSSSSRTLLKNYSSSDFDAISERVLAVTLPAPSIQSFTFSNTSIHQVYNGGNRLARSAIVPNVVDFELDFVANDPFKPKKTCACECGAWAAGHTSHSRSHSSWCPLYKE